MKLIKKKIGRGIYVVIDPSTEEQSLFPKLEMILAKKIAGVQIWDNFKNIQNPGNLIRSIDALCSSYQVPVLINNQWEYLTDTNLDGVHFDFIPPNLDSIKKEIKRDFIIGLTCQNDLMDVKWAAANHLDYISFCSLFPSRTVGTCEIVDQETVIKARGIFENPIFLAGGIFPENLQELNSLKYDGIAVISGIMNSNDPSRAIDEYHKKLNLY